ncbi:MAG: hypothetical protein R3D80_15090 [Paracoccaceae bacterium]
MEQPDRAAEPHFTIPRRQIFLIATALTLFGVGLFFALPKVLPVFLANLYLNLFILFVFVIGLVATLWQVVQLVSSVSWIRGYLEEREGHDPAHPPRLLAPLAGLLRGRGKQMQVGASSARSILDSVAARIDEERDITRYITNLLIFLGLLGTFYGLATTIPALVDTIRSLAPTEGESGIETFTRLQTGLESQLGGMGTAFSSSLLGLAGSLVVGLIELFATHGQNRFYRELEEWLSSITRFGYAPGEEGVPAAGDSSGEAGVWGGYLAEQMEAMRKMFAQADAQRGAADDRLGISPNPWTGSPARSRPRGFDPYLIRIAEGQQQMIAALEGRADDGGGAHVDAESRMRLRSIDVQLLRILEEMSAGRQESLSELRGDIAALTRAISPGSAGRADMALTRRANRNVSTSIWPGSVDAMTALLLVLMFVLTIFMVVQFVLRETISGQESELDILHARVAELASALGLEQDRNAEARGRGRHAQRQHRLGRGQRPAPVGADRLAHQPGRGARGRARRCAIGDHRLRGPGRRADRRPRRGGGDGRDPDRACRRPRSGQYPPHLRTGGAEPGPCPGPRRDRRPDRGRKARRRPPRGARSADRRSQGHRRGARDHPGDPARSARKRQPGGARRDAGGPRPRGDAGPGAGHAQDPRDLARRGAGPGLDTEKTAGTEMADRVAALEAQLAEGADAAARIAALETQLSEEEKARLAEAAAARPCAPASPISKPRSPRRKRHASPKLPPRRRCRRGSTSWKRSPPT